MIKDTLKQLKEELRFRKTVITFLKTLDEKLGEVTLDGNCHISSFEQELSFWFNSSIEQVKSLIETIKGISTLRNHEFVHSDGKVFLYFCIENPYINIRIVFSKNMLNNIYGEYYKSISGVLEEVLGDVLNENSN